MDIGQAIAAIKDGKRVARSGWNGKDMWISYSGGNPQLSAANFWSKANREYAEANGGFAEVRPSMTIKNQDGTISFWAPSVGDTLADDWFIVT